MSKNICLVGTAPDSFNLTPVDNPDWTIWSCSPGTMGIKRADKLFELHRFEPHQPWFQPTYIEYLQNFKGDVIMSAEVPSIKNCKLLPYEALVAKYGPYFFTSSIAWMMAMAIEEGADKIALYGIEMAATTEYHDQRMGCQYFAMLARSMGIEVGVPPESDLLRPAPLYGVCENSHAWIKATVRARDLARRVQEHQAAIDANTQQMHFLKGAMDDQDWHLHSWLGNLDTMGQEFTSPPDVPALQGIGLANIAKAGAMLDAASVPDDLDGIEIQQGDVITMDKIEEIVHPPILKGEGYQPIDDGKEHGGPPRKP